MEAAENMKLKACRASEKRDFRVSWQKSRMLREQRKA
jgi:hypothetical protein